MKTNFKSLNFKLMGLVLVGILPFILGLFFYILPIFENYLMEERKAEVKTSVDLMIGMVDKIRLDAEAKHLDKKIMDEDIQNLFRTMRYNKTDYFFAYSSKGFGTAHGTKPEFVGTDRSESKDPDGRVYVKDFMALAGKEEGGFVPYKFEKVIGQKPIDKISYVKYYPAFDWLIGSGVYLDVVQDQIAAVREKILIGLLFVLIATAAFSWYFSNKICQTIINISNSLFDEADKVADVAINISRASESLSASTTQQASALQETSSSIEETSAMISKNAENAKDSMSISAKSQSTVGQGKEIVNDLIRSIQDIDSSNKEMVKQIEDSNKEIAEIVKVINEIGEKTKVINDIVFQTKLLSFNASVEAARAGEQGKGFAVVAEEVGKLAQMSGNSAKEISDLLGTSIKTVRETIDNSKNRMDKIVSFSEGKVSQGAAVAKRCGEIFDEIVINVNQVNSMIGEIASASNEQANGVKEINSAVSEMDSTGQENSLLSQKTSDYAEQLRGQVENLRRSTAALNTLVKGEEDSTHKAA